MATGAGEKDLRRALMDYALGSGVPRSHAAGPRPTTGRRTSSSCPCARSGDRDREATLSR